MAGKDPRLKVGKKNPLRKRKSTGDGEVVYGHLTGDNEISAVMLRNCHEPEGMHYISLDRTGDAHRKYGTICRSTGSFQVESGDNSKSDEPGIFMLAKNGDIIIKAPSGKIRMEAEKGIELIARGYNNETGSIILDSNEKIVLDGPAITIKANNAVTIVSDKTIDAIARTNYNIYASMIDIVDSVQTSVMQDPGAAITSFLGGSITAHELRMAFKNWISGG